jgi:hypothetical protein
MEGLRQSDELVALAEQLPAPDALLTLKVPRERLPQGLRPTTQEVLLLLEYHQRVQEILDRCDRPDLEVLQVLRVLIEKEIVEERREVARADEDDRVALLAPQEVIAVRDHLGERGTLLEAGSAKLLLLTAAAADVRRLLQALQGIEEFAPEDAFLLGSSALGAGDIGRLAVTDTFSLRLFALPAVAAAAPLWSPFRRRLFGVVSLAPDGALAEAEAFFATQAGVPVARVAAGGEAAPGVFSLHRGDRRALRALLAFLAARYLGSNPHPEGT